MDKQIIRISTAGSVDDGKSTLLGRLLFDSKSLSNDDIDRVRKKSKIEGRIDYSLFTDGLKDEVEQGITIDVAYRYLSTEKRKFIISDTPGHIQYTRNMITGASLSNISLILIDIKKGITEQTKRHLFISSIMFIDHVVICINKMDLVDYDFDKFEEIRNKLNDYCSKLRFKNLIFIPISALHGDNIIKKSESMSWYEGSTLLYLLNNIHINSDNKKIRSRFFVQNIIRDHNNLRIIQGKVQSGVFRKNDEITVFPNLKKTKIIEIQNGFEKTETSYSNMSVSFKVKDELDISRGDLITKQFSLPRKSNKIEVMMCWLSEIDLIASKTYRALRVAEESNCKISNVFYKFNNRNFERELNPNKIELNDICKAEITFSSQFYYDSFEENKEVGSFILIDDSNNTVSCAMIIK